ncbi:polyprenyl synthetase family protein [Candidatus Collierbacteria bacterium]|nr:polyprenyl synthetase family protein [Candidatus Collierbacteria bacterium]
MDGSIGKQYLKDYLDKSDPLFEEHLQKKIDEAREISKIPAELLKRFLDTARRGKKIRGALVTLGYKVAGGTDEMTALQAGLVMELFHTALLIQDDVMDQDNLRRELPALHHQFKQFGKKLTVRGDFLHYGESMVSCVTDAIFYLSWEKLLELNVDSKNIIAAGKTYAQYAVRTAWGQALDITTTALGEIKEKDAMAILRYKSAEYTGVLPLLAGAALAGEKDEKKLRAIKDYGLAFGWAFQIQDDILGMFGDEEKVGKPVGSDLREGKNTLLMLHLAQKGTPEQRAFQRKVLGNKNITKDDVLKMRQILRDARSYQHVVDLGWKYVDEGKKQIPLITADKKLQAILESLIVYMMERVK